MKLTKAQREAVRTMFGGHCAYCGCELGDRWHADHVEAIRRNDWGNFPKKAPEHPERDHIDNLMPACAPCNIDKHSYTLEDWRSMLQRRCGVLQYSHSTYRSMLRFGQIVETAAPIVFHFEKLNPDLPQHRPQG